MKLVNKDKEQIKTINFIKNNKLIFFFFNSYLNTHEWKLIKKKLITKKIFLTSIYINFMALKNKISILVSFKNSFLLSKTLPMLAVKLNKHIYHKDQLKNDCSSYYYINNKLILFKFTMVHLKTKSK